MQVGKACNDNIMGEKIKKLKKIRLHREGTDTLVWSLIAIAAIALLLWRLDTKLPFWIFIAIFGTIYGIVVNFYRCTYNGLRYLVQLF